MKKEIKVYEGRDKKRDPVSQIKLQGRWLEKYGFEIGAIMEVEYETGKMILTVKTDKNVHL